MSGLTVVVPFADARIGLPGVGRNAAGHAALQIQYAGPDFEFREAARACLRIAGAPMAAIAWRLVSVRMLLPVRLSRSPVLPG